MKTIIVSLLASCVVSLAQTNPHNTDSRQLFDAATTNDVETVKVLLNKGVNINAKDTNGATALIKAASIMEALDAKSLNECATNDLCLRATAIRRRNAM